MTDEKIREVERAAADGDIEAACELVRRRIRSGFGWTGEELPPRVAVKENEFGIYELMVPPRPGSSFARAHARPHELVLVEATGLTNAFWISRFPVTVGEWAGFSDVLGRMLQGVLGRSTEPTDFPVTGLNFGEASSFCGWAHAWLPTWDELLVAYGFSDRDDLPRCWRCDASGYDPDATAWNPISCSECNGSPREDRRRYPWGNAKPRSDLSWATQDIKRQGPDAVRDGSGRPSRPCGASPCGVQDAFGNVACWTDLGQVVGPSWRSNRFMYDEAFGPHSPLQDGLTDDIGFRIVVRQ